MDKRESDAREVLDDKTAKRFWAKVDKGDPDDCWLWTAGTRSKGYGCFGFGGQATGAHRVAALFAGMNIKDSVVRHKCDNPLCVNPNHLTTGTLADNNRDMWERGRQKGFAAANALKTHCPKGHELSGSNLRISPRNLRICKKCHNAHLVDLRARKKAIRSLDLSALSCAETNHGR